jgi:alkyldihydroxyacetonephosphate synthase
MKLCNRVKARIRADCKALGVLHDPMVSSRVTQLYDTGACVYFYFGFVWDGLADPVIQSIIIHYNHFSRNIPLRQNIW